MTKKLLTLAAGAMILAPMTSFADTANVNVYGVMNLSWDIANATASTAGSDEMVGRWRLICNSCNFGFKGEDNITEDLKAFFQIESSVDTLLAGGTLNTRNTAVGLKGGFGTVLVGQWDTPFKVAHAFAEPFYGAGAGYMVSLLDTLGSNAGSPTVSSAGQTTNTSNFSRRQGQSLQYWSPKMMGVTVRAAYSTNIDRVSLPGNVAKNPDLLGLSATFEEGPITAAFAFERHDDFRNSVAFASTKDDGFKLAAGYKLMDTTSLNVVGTRLIFKNNIAGGGDSTFTKNAGLASVMHTMGDWTFRGAYGVAGELTGTADSDAKHLAVGASYTLTKRTDVYGIYSKIWNSAGGTYNFVHEATMNPSTTAATTTGNLAAGADPQVVGLGVRHVF